MNTKDNKRHQETMHEFMRPLLNCSGKPFKTVC